MKNEVSPTKSHFFGVKLYFVGIGGLDMAQQDFVWEEEKHETNYRRFF